MIAEIRKSDLTPRQRQLVERMQRMGYGRIENLVVRDGDPVFERGTTKVIRSVRLEGRTDPHVGSNQGDPVLKTKVVNLLRQLAEMGDGVVAIIHVGSGLPGSMEVEDEADDAFDVAVPDTPQPTRPPLRAAAVEVIHSGDAR
jgi:hypothetical protein